MQVRGNQLSQLCQHLGWELLGVGVAQLWHCPNQGISALLLPGLLSLSQCQTLWLHWKENISSLPRQSPGNTKIHQQEQLFADFLLRPVRC